MGKLVPLRRFMPSKTRGGRAVAEKATSHATSRYEQHSTSERVIEIRRLASTYEHDMKAKSSDVKRALKEALDLLTCPSPERR